MKRRLSTRGVILGWIPAAGFARGLTMDSVGTVAALAVAFFAGAVVFGLGAIAVSAGVAVASPTPVVSFATDGPAAEPALARCRRVLDLRGGDLAAVILPATSHPDSIFCLLLGTTAFQTRFSGRLPDWGIGAAVPGGRLIAIDYERLPGVGRSVEEVFLHELTHALIQQAMGRTWMPSWFHEGVAMWLSGEWRFVDTIQVVLNGTLPPLWRLQGPFPANAAWADQAYRTSLLAVESLRRWYGEDVIRRLIVVTVESGDFTAAFVAVTGESDEVFADRFADAMRVRFGWLIMLTRWPSLFVLMALLFAAGATARLIRKRRRLAAMPDD